MRVPTEERRRFRVRGWMIAVVIILIVLLFSLRGLAGFYVDALWFDSLGQGSTWGRLLAAKIVPATVFTVVFFLIVYTSLLIADRLAPRLRPQGPMTPEDEMVARYQQVTGRYQGRIRVGIALFFALIAGIGVSAQWKEWILFTHRVDFNIKDPQFHKDIGFYVFQLPFIQFMLEWLFAGLVIVLLVTAVAHYLNGGIRFQSPVQRRDPAGEGAPLGDPRRDGAREDGPVLLRPVRAGLLQPGGRRRRRLHGRPRAAARAGAADLHLGGRRVAVHLEHPAPGLGPAGHRRRAVGIHLADRRHDLPGRRSRTSRSSRTSSRARRSTSAATSRRRVPRSTSTRST